MLQFFNIQINKMSSQVLIEYLYIFKLFKT